LFEDSYIHSSSYFGRVPNDVSKYDEPTLFFA